MNRDPLLGVATFVAPLGPGVSPSERDAREEGWLGSLSESDVARLLSWLWEPRPIPHEQTPLTADYLDEAADRVARYVAIASKRLRIDQIRLEFERMLCVPKLQMPALEGLDIIGDEKSIPAIRASAGTSSRAAAVEAAMVLASIGGPDAVEALSGLSEQWFHDAVVLDTIRSCVSEANLNDK